MTSLMTFRITPGLLLHIAFIGLVSVYDAWLVVLHSDDILDFEHNLVGQYLIRRMQGDVTLFVACKLCGTAVVTLALAWLGTIHYRLAVPVARSLTVFQLWLLWFLKVSETYDPRTPLFTGMALTAVLGICVWPLVAERCQEKTITPATAH